MSEAPPESGYLKLVVQVARGAAFFLVVVFELSEEWIETRLVPLLDALPNDGFAVASVILLVGLTFATMVRLWPNSTIKKLWPLPLSVSSIVAAVAYALRWSFEFPATLARWTIIVILALTLGAVFAALIRAIRADIMLGLVVWPLVLCLLAVGLIISFTRCAGDALSTPDPIPSDTPLHETPTPDSSPSATPSPPTVTPISSALPHHLTPTASPASPTPLPCPTITNTQACSGGPIQPGQNYLIQPGDTLSCIALRSGRTVPQLQEANSIPDVNHIEAGQELLIPATCR